MMEANRILRPTVWTVLLLICSIQPLVGGCAGNTTPTAPVSGTVTLNGQPLANVSVLFQPVGGANRDPGAGSYAITDAQGKFTLKFSDSNKPGAIVGQHTVTIVEKTDPANDQDAGDINKSEVSRIPAEFSNNSTKFEVKSGASNLANFELKSPAK